MFLTGSLRERISVIWYSFHTGSPQSFSVWGRAEGLIPFLGRGWDSHGCLRPDPLRSAQELHSLGHARIYLATLRQDFRLRPFSFCKRLLEAHVWPSLTGPAILNSRSLQASASAASSFSQPPSFNNTGLSFGSHTRSPK